MASSSSGGGGTVAAAPPTSSASVPRKQPISSTVSAKATSDPVLRNTLRYTISAREYALLHQYVLSRNRQIKKRMPSIEMVNKIMNGDAPMGEEAARSGARTGSNNNKKDEGKGKSKGRALAELDVANVASTSAGLDAGAGAMLGADDFNARAVRHSLRVFGVTAVGMKLYGLAMQKFGGMKAE